MQTSKNDLTKKIEVQLMVNVKNEMHLIYL